MVNMTAEPTASFLPHGRPFSRTDLDGMPDDGNRYELIDGTLIVTPAPSPQHQDVVVGLVLALAPNRPTHLKLLVAPLDVELTTDTIVQPDVLVAERTKLNSRQLTGPPVLAIEVLSPSTRHLDLAFKRARYEAAGCASYWVVDPLAPSVICWDLVDGEYREVARATGEQKVTLTRPYAVTFAPAELVD